MKILHICLAAFYIDNYGYQENLLTKFHKLLGHEVFIIASTESYGSKREKIYLTPSKYLNENNIMVHRLPYNRYLPKILQKKVRSYHGLKSIINEFSPDIIFVHGVQFFDAYVIRNYLKRNLNIDLFIDNHSDFGNSAKGFFSRVILHKIFYRICAKTLEPYTKAFFGTTPLRSDFLTEMYGINPSLVHTLPTGYDDSIINLSDRNEIRDITRHQLGLNKENFVIITGGKIDARKEIGNLIDAIKEVEIKEIKLLLFGMPDLQMQSFYDSLNDLEFVIKLGWLNQKELQESIVSSDLAIFPGTHSVVWEQVVGLGVPSIFRKWKGFEHVDLGGNCIFLNKANKEEIIEVLTSLLRNESDYGEMLESARLKGPQYFSYTEIAKQSIKIP